MSGTFVATVNADLKVGVLQETITVTGETPIVDVQSAKVQNIVNKDILAAIPTSRNATGTPGVDSGHGHHRRCRRHHRWNRRRRVEHARRPPVRLANAV